MPVRCTGIILFVLNLSIWTQMQTRELWKLCIGPGHMDPTFVADHVYDAAK
jgi:hypothetical protein